MITGFFSVSAGLSISHWDIRFNWPNTLYRSIGRLGWRGTAWTEGIQWIWFGPLYCSFHRQEPIEWFPQRWSP